jgi:hypothetical protein
MGTVRDIANVFYLVRVSRTKTSQVRINCSINNVSLRYNREGSTDESDEAFVGSTRQNEIRLRPLNHFGSEELNQLH